jgi:glycosyltransferase involved in cell wall biosynthesis
MRIGIDAKWFFSGNPSGRVVTRNIIEHILRKYPQNDYYIFLKKHEINNAFPYSAANIHLVYIWGRINLISNYVFLPLKALFLKLDVCLFQSFCPPISPYKKVTFIFDVIFKTNPEYFTFWERTYFIPMIWSAKASSRVITISQSEKKRISDLKICPAEKISVIHMGVDRAFKPLEQQSAEAAEEVIRKYCLPDRYLLYVGRLNQRKNIGNLLKSVPLLKDKRIKLVLAGAEDWKMFNVQNSIQDLNITERVQCTGFVNNDHLPFLYSLATIFCYVSFDEAFGLPPLESMASGVPVIVANTGSLPEVCGNAGVFIDPHNPQDIADKIDLLLENNDLYKAKKAEGQQRATMFTWENSADLLIKYLLETAAPGNNK